MRPERYFQFLVLFTKMFLKECRLCCFGEGGIGFFRITQNLLNKKLSVFPHSWRPIIATQIEKLEAGRREILLFNPNSLHTQLVCAKCVQVLWSVTYWISLSASATFEALHWAECSNPRRWHWEGNPLGRCWCQILWGYLSRLNASQRGDIYLLQTMEKTICHATLFSFGSLGKRKLLKYKSKHKHNEVSRGIDSRWGWPKYTLRVECWHSEYQQENLLVAALELCPYSLSRQRQYKHQRLNCPWANSAQLFKRRKWPTLFPPLYTQAGVRHSVAATRARLIPARVWHRVTEAGGWQRSCPGALPVVAQMGTMYGPSLKMPRGQADTFYWLSWRNWLKPLLKTQVFFLKSILSERKVPIVSFKSLIWERSPRKQNYHNHCHNTIPPSSSIFCYQNRILK